MARIVELENIIGQQANRIGHLEAICFEPNPNPANPLNAAGPTPVIDVPEEDSAEEEEEEDDDDDDGAWSQATTIPWVPPQAEAEAHAEEPEGLPLIPVGGVPSRQALGVHVRAIHLVLEDHKNDIIYNQQHVDENTVAINKINTKHVVLVNKHNHLVANQNQIDREQVAQKSRMKNLAMLAIKNKKRSKKTARKCRNMVAVIKNMKQKMRTMAEYIDDQDHMLTETRLQVKTLATVVKNMEKDSSASSSSSSSGSRDGALLSMMMAKMNQYDASLTDSVNAMMTEARQQVQAFINRENEQMNGRIGNLRTEIRACMASNINTQDIALVAFYKLALGQVVAQGDFELPPSPNTRFPLYPQPSAMLYIEQQLEHFKRQMIRSGVASHPIIHML